MKKKKYLSILCIALALSAVLSSVAFAGGYYPSESVPITWNGIPFLKNGIITEFNKDKNDVWSVSVFYEGVEETKEVVIPTEVIDVLSIGQTLKFLVKDSDYSSEWAGLNSDMFTHYATSLLIYKNPYTINQEEIQKTSNPGNLIS